MSAAATRRANLRPFPKPALRTGLFLTGPESVKARAKIALLTLLLVTRTLTFYERADFNSVTSAFASLTVRLPGGAGHALERLTCCNYRAKDQDSHQEQKLRRGHDGWRCCPARHRKTEVSAPMLWPLQCKMSSMSISCVRSGSVRHRICQMPV